MLLYCAVLGVLCFSLFVYFQSRWERLGGALAVTDITHTHLQRIGNQRPLIRPCATLDPLPDEYVSLKWYLAPDSTVSYFDFDHLSDLINSFFVSSLVNSTSPTSCALCLSHPNPLLFIPPSIHV